MTDQQSQESERLGHRTEFRNVLKESMVEIFHAYQGHLEDLERKIAELERRCEQSKVANDTIMHKERDVQEKFSHLQDKYDALEHKYDESTREITKLNTRLASRCRKCQEFQTSLTNQARTFQSITEAKDSLIKELEHQLVTQGQVTLGTNIQRKKSKVKDLESQLTQQVSQDSESDELLTNQSHGNNPAELSNALKANKKAQERYVSFAAEKSRPKRNSDENVSGKKQDDRVEHLMNEEETVDTRVFKPLAEPNVSKRKSDENVPKRIEDAAKDRRGILHPEEETVDTAVIIVPSKSSTLDTSPSGVSKLKLPRGEKRLRYKEKPLIENKKSRLSSETESNVTTSISKHNTDVEMEKTASRTRSQEKSMSRIQRELKDRPAIIVPETMPMEYYDNEEEEEDEERETEKGSILNPEVIDSEDSTSRGSCVVLTGEQNQDGKTNDPDMEYSQSEVTSPVFDGRARGSSVNPEGKSMQSPSLFDSSTEVPLEKKAQRSDRRKKSVITVTDSPICVDSPSVLSGGSQKDNKTISRAKLSTKRAKSVSAVSDSKLDLEISVDKSSRRFRQSTLSQAFDSPKPRIRKSHAEYNGESVGGRTAEEQEELLIQKATEESLRAQNTAVIASVNSEAGLNYYTETGTSQSMHPLITSTPYVKGRSSKEPMFKRPSTPKRHRGSSSGNEKNDNGGDADGLLSPDRMNGSIDPNVQLTEYDKTNLSLASGLGSPPIMELEAVSIVDIDAMTDEGEKETQTQAKGAASESITSAVFGARAPDSCRDVFDSQAYGGYKETEDSFDVVPKAKTNEPTYAHVDVVRKKADRAKLNTYACWECEKYFGALGLSEQEKQERMAGCKHKAKYARPTTPEHYWSVGFPDTQECAERGYLNETMAKPSKARRRKPFKKLFDARNSSSGGGGGAATSVESEEVRNCSDISQ